MPLVRTDRPALVVGAVVMALFTLEVVRTGLVMAARTTGSVDAWVVMALATGLIYALLFLAGHYALRKRLARSRVAYAAIGAAAAVPPFLLATGWTALAEAGGRGCCRRCWSARWCSARCSASSIIAAPAMSAATTTPRRWRG